MSLCAILRMMWYFARFTFCVNWISGCIIVSHCSVNEVNSYGGHYTSTYNA